METKKQKNSPIVFYILSFIVAVFFELYWIGTFPYDYFMLIGIGLVVLITGYLTFDGIIKAYNEAREIKYEQSELMIKAQKAIYLATKKGSSENEIIQSQNLQALNLLADRMVETITSKQIESKSDSADISGLINELTDSNAKLAKELQNAITVSELVKANADLVKNVQNILNGKPEAYANDIVLSDDNTNILKEDSSSNVSITEPVLESAPIVNTIENDVFAFDSETDPLIEIEPAIDAEPITDTEHLTDNDEINATINIDEMTLEELDEMNSEIASVEAAVAMASDTIEAIEATNDLEAVIDESDSIEEDLTNADSINDIEKDPNAMLSADDIAKLFAEL